VGLDSELLEAARKGDARRVRELLDRGADVNARDVFDRTPLHLAAAFGHLDVAKLLLDRGADIDARESDGWTPLHYAAVNGRLDVARLLLERGADAGIKSRYGETPADLAREYGFESVAEFIDSWARRGGGAGQAARGRVEGTEQVVREARSHVEVLGVEAGVVEGW